MLGGGSEATKSRRRSRLPEEEDEGGGGSTGRPGLSTSTMRKTELRRFFQTQWMGEGGPVAMVVLVGGGGRVRVVRGREPEEGRSTGESERGQGGAWRLRGVV